MGKKREREMNEAGGNKKCRSRQLSAKGSSKEFIRISSPSASRQAPPCLGRKECRPMNPRKNVFTYGVVLFCILPALVACYVVAQPASSSAPDTTLGKATAFLNGGQAKQA